MGTNLVGWLTARTVWLGSWLLLTLCVALPAAAEIIDRIDVVPAGKEAEIVIRFTTTVQYQRHVPRTGGNLLQIFIVQPNTPTPSRIISPETIRQRATSLSPAFTASYPDLNGALTVRFERKTFWRVREGRDQRSISIFVPAVAQPAVKPEVKPEAKAEVSPELKPVPPEPQVVAPPPVMPAPLGAPEVQAMDRQAKTLLTAAKEAMARRDFTLAIETLNRLLNLPPNSSLEEAQILIGEAREGNGETAKALVEYQLYLKLFPEGAYTVKARQRVAALSQQSTGAAIAGAEARLPAPRREEDTGWVLTGSLSQNYYHGNSHIEILTPPPPGELTFSKDTLSATDQSALVTNLDLSYRRRTATSDSRFVLRDTDTRNFLSGQEDRNRLNSAYYERNDKQYGYLARIGRQTASSGGVLGRFDGVWAGYNLSPGWRVNAVAGLPVEYDVTWDKSFYGLSVDMIPQAEKLTASAFVVAQEANGARDREAVGMEARYFDARSNYFALLDYDILFNALNIAMFQGNYQFANGVNLFFLADHRKSPILQLTNAVPGLPEITLKAALAAGISEEALREKAMLKTADADLFQIGFTKPMTRRWQLGADYRLANVSEVWIEDPTTGVLTLTPGTGNIHVYSGQAIGNSVLRDNDLAVANVSFIVAPKYDGVSLSLSHVLNMERWRLDSTLGFYHEDRDDGGYLQRWSPIFRLAYKLRENWWIESELGMEASHSESLGVEDDTRRVYFFVGYRWEW